RQPQGRDRLELSFVLGSSARGQREIMYLRSCMGKSTLASLVVLTLLTLLVVSTPLPAGKDNIFVPLIDLPKGLAVVYFFKDHSYGKAEHRVYANGKMVGVLTKGTYFPLLVQPGQVSISS